MKKINIKTFQQLNKLYYMQVCKTLYMESQVLPPLLISHTTQPPSPTPTPTIFFLLFKKILAVENKYSVLDLPRNKYSGRARDENK